METNRLRFLLFFACVGGCVVASSAHARSKKADSDSGIFYSYAGNLDADLGVHLYSPMDMATQKMSASFAETADLGHGWKGVAGFSAWDETVYATEPARYSGAVVQDDSSDLRIRDLYLQYQADHFFVRAGNQQAVWGEAFGYFYADIVNPRDERYGEFGDFTDIRLQTPMLNTKLIFSDFSLQFIGIPQPYFSLLPSPGNDFAYPYKSVLPSTNIEIRRQTSMPLASGNEELGGRVGYLWNHLDLSAFYFWYYDRSPWYTFAADSSAQNIFLQEQHSRVQSAGLTATDDFGGFILRFEGVATKGRVLPSVTNVFGVPTLGSVKVNNYVYVLGVDVPTLGDLNGGVQWSQDILDDNPQGLLRTQTESVISLHLQYSLFQDQTAELLYSYQVSDAGERLQFNYILPISNTFESRFGVDFLGGPFSSDFGKIYEATRAYVVLKCYLRS